MVAVGNERFYGGYDSRKNLEYDFSVASDTKRRLAWFERNYELCFGRLPKEEIPKCARALWDEIRKKRAETAQSTPRHTMPKTPLTLPPRDQTVIMEPMRPVPPEVRKHIYQGLSQDGEGPGRYLRERYKEFPEDRYYLMDCTNWHYGWNIKNVKLHKYTRLPRIHIIQTSFYRRGGVERDPDHYRDAVKMEAAMTFPQL
ncbi:UNVERIFIED_CONTAM: hypothetical protein PYX00_005669 [Menopon gallinae]|uniref:Sperm microtubule inner protein 1 C-terminal domain-containing protein n=1 Tax=Menopon gallinae TaxID=328185 RepID=A0AAW2HTM0_9NEOP